jgi:hypothetical protein
VAGEPAMYPGTTFEKKQLEDKQHYHKDKEFSFQTVISMQQLSLYENYQYKMVL